MDTSLYTVLEWTSVVLSLSYVILLTREVVWAWPAGILGSALSLFVLFGCKALQRRLALRPICGSGVLWVVRMGLWQKGKTQLPRRANLRQGRDDPTRTRYPRHCDIGYCI